MYWIAAILPVRLSWHIDLTVSQPEIIEQDSFTQCLWTTIYHTKKIDWAREYVPKTEVWNQWLLDAENKVRLGVELESWDAFGALNSLLKERHKPE